MKITRAQLKKLIKEEFEEARLDGGRAAEPSPSPSSRALKQLKKAHDDYISSYLNRVTFSLEAGLEALRQETERYIESRTKTSEG
jgi:hypothetical protein